MFFFPATGAVESFAMTQVGATSLREKARSLLRDLKSLWVERGFFKEEPEKIFSIEKESEQAGARLQQETVGNNN